MSKEPMDIYNREREERMNRIVPTRDSLIVPSFNLAQQKQTADQKRIDEHERAKAADLFRKMYPGATLPEELREDQTR